MRGDSERMMEDALALGRANVETMELARRHCLNMTFVEAGGRGMAEAMSGLPINSRRVECQYARGNGWAMNLEWVALDFYTENCIGCEYRRPTGEVPNLATLVEERDAAGAATDVESRALLEQKRETWSQRQERRRGLLADADPVMHGVLEDIDTLDVEPGTELDAATRDASVRRLDALADRAPGTFTDAVVDLVVALIENEHITELLDPLRRLTRTRSNLSTRALAAAIATLRAGPDSHAEACVTELATHLTADLMDVPVMSSLIIAAGAPEERFGLQPREPNNPAALRAVAEVAPDVVRAALLELLPLPSESSTLVSPSGSSLSRAPTQVDDFTRASAAGAARWLATTQPQIAVALIQSERPWVVDSTKFERAFGWGATPLPDAVFATVAWFQEQARA